MPSIHQLSLATTVCACLAGCLPLEGSINQYPAARRFSAEYSCKYEKIKLVNLGASTYRASGCGVTAIYACAGNTCVKESASGPRVAARQQAASPRVVQAPPQQDRVVRRPDPATGKAILDAVIGGGALELRLTAMPASNRDTVWFRVWLRTAERNHGQCDVKMMIDGQLLVLPKPAYSSTAEYEELLIELPVSDLVAVGKGTRVKGRICSGEFELVGPRLEIIREFLMRFREELSWEDESASDQQGDGNTI